MKLTYFLHFFFFLLSEKEAPRVKPAKPDYNRKTATGKFEGLPTYTGKWTVGVSCHNKIGHVTLVAIPGTTSLVPYVWVEPLQLIWRLGTWALSYYSDLMLSQ